MSVLRLQPPSQPMVLQLRSRCCPQWEPCSPEAAPSGAAALEGAREAATSVTRQHPWAMGTKDRSCCSTALHQHNGLGRLHTQGTDTCDPAQGTAVKLVLMEVLPLREAGSTLLALW